MFHHFDCFGVGPDGERFCDRGEGGVRVVNNVLRADAQLLSLRYSFEEIANVFV